MIFTVKQMKTNFDMLWFAEDKNGQNICAILCPFTKGYLDIDFNYGENMCRDRLYYNPNSTEYGSSIKDRLSFRFFRDGHYMAPVEVLTKKVKGLFQSYQYRKINDNNQNFYMYEVGLGSKGLFLCFYKEDELIAIADKTLTVVNFQDEYKIYAISENFIRPIMALLIQYDMTAHGDVMDVAVHSVVHKKVNTIQKELITKYDPEFIPRVKAMQA